MAASVASLRASFDAIDGEILRLVVARRAVSREMAGCKVGLGLPLRDEVRERELLARLTAAGEADGLDGALVTRLFGLLLADSLAVQEAFSTSAT